MDAKTDLEERIRATLAVRDNAHSFHYVQLQNDLAIMRALQELLASLSANAASMLHLVRERVADSIGQQCSTQ